MNHIFIIRFSIIRIILFINIEYIIRYISIKRNKFFIIDYFIIDFSQSQIRLKNQFKGKTGVRFITLTDEQLQQLTELKDDFLCKYYFYLRANCGTATNGTTDSTAEQALSALGYSTRSAEYKNKISSCNALLTRCRLIEVSRWRDEAGHDRNTYRALS